MALAFLDHRGTPVVLATVVSGADATGVATRLAAREPAVAHVGIVSDDVGPELGPILAALAPVLAEIFFVDALAGGATGFDLSMRALAEIGIGQDFVFTVADLGEAIERVVAALASQGRGGFDGEALLVIGPSTVTDAARRHVQPA